ncbi:MAG TPA: hypothetical protein VF624_12845 [Tepidisphaeraceae bacterium]
MLPPQHPRRELRRWLLTVTAVLLLAYLLLQNPYWVPGGDSDFYVTVARNLAAPHNPAPDDPAAGTVKTNFTYNGVPVAISPPGWPWVMAMMMKVSPYFLSLKLVTMTCMLASLVVSYVIAVRFVSPRLAALAIGMTGLLMPVYSLTYFLHSEGLYCLLSAAALLLALRVRERPGRRWEAALLVAVCVAIPFVRWAGLFQLLPVAAVLLSDRWQRTGRRRWATAALCALAIVGVWYGTRTVLENRFDAFVASVGELPPDVDTGQTAEGKSVELLAAGDAGRGPVAEYLHRFLHAGKWFAWLLWYPSRFASVGRSSEAVVSAVGWVVIAFLAYLAINRLRRGELLWPALAVYCGALCMNWPNANARYFVPVAPLIVVGIFVALRDLSERYPAKSFDRWKWLRRAFAYSVLLCNLAMYGVDVIVMRSSRFYTDFEAGQHKGLVDIAHYLTTLPAPPADPTTTQPATLQLRPRDGEVVVNERYENLNRVRNSKASTRAMTLLTDRNIKTLDTKKNKSIYPDDPQPDGTLAFPGTVRREIRRVGGRWMLVQSPVVPWRVWHFRLPRAIHERLAKVKGRPDSGGWTAYFYVRENNTLTAQPVPNVDNWPTRVPGL